MAARRVTGGRRVGVGEPVGSGISPDLGRRSTDTCGERLRPATDADDDFCLRLNLATMREYVEPIYGWDLDVQRRQHAAWFNADRLSIIEEDDGAAIGVLDVSDESDHLYVSRVEILPEVQGRGIGTAVMEALMGQGRTIRLRVFTNNVRARRFYERLGFILDHDSEDEHHLSMYRSPQSSQERSSRASSRSPSGTSRVRRSGLP